MDIIQFFGRFHVLVLHLPIGILMLSALMEIHTNYKQRPRNELLNWVWFWGAMSAIAACVLGWMLSQDDGYSADAVFIHRTFGICVALVAIVCWLSFSRNLPKWLVNSLSVGQLLLLFSTGHYGANMTHGETYLVEHAPNSVRYLMGFEPHAEPRPPITRLEDALIYEDLVEPMLSKRCVSCHNDSKQKGKLNLANIDAIMAGGRTGPAIVPFDESKSVLFQRITLPHGDKEFMPAEGKTPLTDEQVSAISWWINSGASASGNVTQFEMSKEQKLIIQTVLGLTPSEFDLPPVAPIDSIAYQTLRDAGFVVKQISQDINYLELDFSASSLPLNEAKFALLLSHRSHIVGLNLRGSNYDDSFADSLGQLTLLRHLRLDHTLAGNETVNTLSKLNSLSYLNLYGTAIDDGALGSFIHFAALNALHIGATQATSNAISTFAADVTFTVTGGEQRSKIDAQSTNKNH